MEDDLRAYTSTTFGPGLIPFDARTVPDTRTYSVSASSSSSQDWESNEAVRRYVTIEQEEILLYLYFLNQGVFGLEMNAEAFFERRSKLGPSHHPHTSLVLAMILMVSNAMPGLSDQGDDMYVHARRAVDRAVGADEAPMDAMRAALLLSIWLLGRARYPEAWVLLGTATRLATCCGLDIIPSNTLDPASYQDNPLLLRHAQIYLPPPRTQTELSDRLYAFWAIFLVDRCYAIGFGWQPAFDHRSVVSPLPGPWRDIEDGICVDERLTGPCHAGRPTPRLASLVKLTLILHQSTLRNTWLPPHSSPRIRPAYPDPVASLEDLAAVLARIDPHLLEIHNEGQTRSIDQYGAKVLLLRGAVELHVHDENSEVASNDKALEVGHRMIGVLRIVGATDTGSLGLLVVIIMREICRILIVQIQRLENLHAHIDAVLLEAELQFVLECINRAGPHVEPFIQSQLAQIRSWRGSIVAGERPEAYDSGSRRYD